MSTTTLLPDPAEVGDIAGRILAAIHADPEHGRLIDGCGRYSDDWKCTTGAITVANWNIHTDAVPLLEEALRALALKAAVYALTGDEHVAELPIAAPVDQVLHAVLAQRTLTERLAQRCGFQIIHMTDTEQHADPYEPGGYTWTAYLDGFKVAPPTRYWISDTEHDRRAALLAEMLDSIGLHERGGRHELTFTAPATQEAPQRAPCAARPARPPTRTG